MYIRSLGDKPGKSSKPIWHWSWSMMIYRAQIQGTGSMGFRYKVLDPLTQIQGNRSIGSDARYSIYGLRYRVLDLWDSDAGYWIHGTQIQSTGSMGHRYRLLEDAGYWIHGTQIQSTGSMGHRYRLLDPWPQIQGTGSMGFRYRVLVLWGSDTGYWIHGTQV